MKLRLRNLSDQTIVITGATSGIGLVTARMAARAGCRVVGGARSEDALRELEEEIARAGGQAVMVATDVTAQGDLRRLAETAIERFGGIDTWVNNAGVSVFGETISIPIEVERRVFEVNYWGLVYGSRTAVEFLRDRGGALINLGSVASDRTIPLQAAYCASKHAVKAYTDTLRMELEHAKVPISVTLIKPTAIDTPFFRHAPTYMEAQPTEPSPMYAPEAVAEAILHAAEHPVRDLLVGETALLESALGRYAPRLGDQYMKATMFEGQQSQRPPLSDENQILERPAGKLRERGLYEARVLERSVYTKMAMHPILAGALALGAGLGAVALARAVSRSRAASEAEQFEAEYDREHVASDL